MSKQIKLTPEMMREIIEKDKGDFDFTDPKHSATFPFYYNSQPVVMSLLEMICFAYDLTPKK